MHFGIGLDITVCLLPVPASFDMPFWCGEWERQQRGE
jgi:hypothetical protein